VIGLGALNFDAFANGYNALAPVVPRGDLDGVPRMGGGHRIVNGHGARYHVDRGGHAVALLVFPVLALLVLLVLGAVLAFVVLMMLVVMVPLVALLVVHLANGLRMAGNFDRRRRRLLYRRP
jgi:hypothetical protein